MHSVCTTAASVAGAYMLPHLLHGEETKVWGDGGYQGQTEAIRQAASKAKDMTCRRTRFGNRQRGAAPQEPDQLARTRPGRASVPHPRLRQVRFRRLEKNHYRLGASFALVNLYVHRKRLAVLGAYCVRKA